MFINLLTAVAVIFAATGAVLVLMIFLQRLIRPEAGSYSLYVHTNEDDFQNEAVISYIVQRLRFFGEEKCTTVFVCCENLQAEQVLRLKNTFCMYDFVQFIGLDEAETQKNEKRNK